MRARREVLAIDLQRAGVVIRGGVMQPRVAWMFEGVAPVARRALALAVIRASMKARSGRTKAA